jgi:hypothetical protein
LFAGSSGGCLVGFRHPAEPIRTASGGALGETT